MPWYLWVVVIYLAVGFVISAVTMWKTQDGWSGEEPGDEMVLFIGMIVLWFPALAATYFSDLRARHDW